MFAPSQRFVSVFSLEWRRIKFSSPGSLVFSFQILRLMERYSKMLIVTSFKFHLSESLAMASCRARRDGKWLAEYLRLQTDLGHNARTVYCQINAMILVTKHHNAETTSLKTWLPPSWMERSKELWLGDEGTVEPLARVDVCYCSWSSMEFWPKRFKATSNKVVLRGA